MADYWEQWFTNPAQNNMAPPFGAGEKKMPFDQITDTFRVVMAACAQLGSKISTIKNMAYQDKDNVKIDGGRINALVDMSATAIKRDQIALDRIPTQLVGKLADGLTTPFKQTLYNYINPVGIVRLWHIDNLSLLTWPGVTATWQKLPSGEDRIIVTSGSVLGTGAGAGQNAYRQTSLPIAAPGGATGGGGYGLLNPFYDPYRFGFALVHRIA